jgi:hypothetical protein
LRQGWPALVRAALVDLTAVLRPTKLQILSLPTAGGLQPR